jgi:hypothetical protein
VSAAGLDGLAALRGEVDEIARDAGRIPPGAAEGIGAASYSFGIFASAEAKVAAIFQSIQQAVGQTLAQLAPVAQFETTVGGFTARTVVNYSGFAASAWSSGATAELAAAHLASLRRIYAFRAAAAAVVAAVGNAVVAISIAVGNPLTVWHAVKSAEALKAAVERLAAAVAAEAQSSQAAG